MKYVFTFLLFILPFSNVVSQNSGEIKILTIDGSPLDDVSIYFGNELLGFTNVLGVFKLHENDIDKLVLIKAGFLEKLIYRSEFNDDIILHKLGIRELDAVEITNRDATSEFKNLLEKTRSGNLYKYKSDNAIYNSFTSGSDTLHYLNNKVYWIPKKGLHIESTKNVVQNFKSHRNGDIISNIYEIDEIKLELSFHFTNRSLNMSWIQPFVDLNNGLKDYNFFFSKKGDTIKVDFEPKNESKNITYTGQITYNQLDYGIYEMEFKSIGSRSYNNYINGSKRTKISLRDYDEYLFISNVRGEDGMYYAKGAEYLLTTQILNTTAKGRILKQDFRVSPILNVQPTTEIKFDLYTYEFSHLQ